MNLQELSPLLLAVVAALNMSTETSEAQPAGFNYDEAKVPSYTLPDPLQGGDGTRVTTAEAWKAVRRPEILRLFETEVYGRSPAPPTRLRFEKVSEDAQALQGLATRREIQIHLGDAPDSPSFRVLLYLPNKAKGPVPAFVGLNFQGNHTIHHDPGIALRAQWTAPKGGEASRLEDPDPTTRGSQSRRWPVEMILQRGYALATAFYGDLEPDHATGWQQGIRAKLPSPKTSGEIPAALQSSAASFPPGASPEAWGAIGAWAYGLSRMLDYLGNIPEVNARQVALLGHSRLGKTSLWAGAQDERFAIVISNNSGCGGAALNRRHFGETVQRINTSFPHWFCMNFKKYNERENDLPLDQHMLIALIAPRPVYIASAEEDLWADPRGEFLAGKHAEPVYALFGKKGLTVEEPPPLDRPVGEAIGYHIRTGKHDVTPYDWEQYLAFADRHFGR